MNGIGAHEVIIETPEHDESLATMPAMAIERVLWAFRERVLDLKQDTPLPLHPGLQEPRRRGRCVARPPALAADRAADRAAHGARRGRRRAAALSAEGALRLLRHHPAGAGRADARHLRERGLRGALAVRAAVCVRDVAAAEAPWRRRSRRPPRHEYESLARMLKETLQRMNRDAAVAAVQPDHPQRAVRRTASRTSTTGTWRSCRS